MQITFLGTGTSTGVPEIGCQCEVCTSADRRDWRLRTSVLVETEGKRILLDCGPDFRWQMIRSKNTSRLDAVLISHEHYDHVGGLDAILGYRIGNMAYLTDVKYLPETEYTKLEGLDLLVLTALRQKPHPTHESLDEALANVDRIRPKAAYLIHMSHTIGLHAAVEKTLPPHVHLAYDGLQVLC